MFVETITSPRTHWEDWNRKLRMLDDPPEALVAAVVWEVGDGRVTALHLWDTPASVGDFYLERVRELVEAEGEPADKPSRHGEPVATYFRQSG